MNRSEKKWNRKKVFFLHEESTVAYCKTCLETPCIKTSTLKAVLLTPTPLFYYILNTYANASTHNWSISKSPFPKSGWCFLK